MRICLFSFQFLIGKLKTRLKCAFFTQFGPGKGDATGCENRECLEKSNKTQILKLSSIPRVFYITGGRQQFYLEKFCLYISIIITIFLLSSIFEHQNLLLPYPVPERPPHRGPFPGSLESSGRAWWYSALCLAIERPSPVPLVSPGMGVVNPVEAFKDPALFQPGKTKDAP